MEPWWRFWGMIEFSLANVGHISGYRKKNVEISEKNVKNVGEIEQDKNHNSAFGPHP